MIYDLIMNADELYDEARRELGSEIRFGSRDDMIHEYVVERLSGASPKSARYQAVRRTQRRKFWPWTRIGLDRDVFYDGDEPVDSGSVTYDDRTLEIVATVTRAVDDLSNDERVVVRMRFGFGGPSLGPSDIARETGFSLSRVERLLRSAKSEIAERLRCDT